MQNLANQRDLILFIEERGFQAERVFNTTQMKLDGTELRVVGLTLIGPRGNKGFVPLQEGFGDLEVARLWCDGVDYATGQASVRKEVRNIVRKNRKGLNTRPGP